MPRGGKRENAGRKPTGKNPRKKISVHISALPEEVEQLKALAEQSGKTLSRFLVELALQKEN